MTADFISKILRGGLVLSLFLFSACGWKNDREFVKDAFLFDAHAYLDSQRVLVSYLHLKVYRQVGGAADGEESAEPVGRRFFAVRSDSQAPIQAFASVVALPDVYSDPYVGPLTFDYVAPGILLEPSTGTLFDAAKDTVIAVSADGLPPKAYCQEGRKNAQGTSWAETKAGPNAGTYVLTCHDQMNAQTKSAPRRFFLIDEKGKATRLRADSSGQSWAAAGAVGGELWGAFRSSDSQSILHRPLDSSGAAREIRIPLPQNVHFNDFEYLHTAQGPWFGEPLHAVKMEGPAADFHWSPVVAITDDPVFDADTVTFDPSGRSVKIRRADGSGAAYDFTEYMK
jgi:hypothetical protein